MLVVWPLNDGDLWIVFKCCPTQSGLPTCNIILLIPGIDFVIFAFREGTCKDVWRSRTFMIYFCGVEQTAFQLVIPLHIYNSRLSMACVLHPQLLHFVCKHVPQLFYLLFLYLVIANLWKLNDCSICSGYPIALWFSRGGPIQFRLGLRCIIITQFTSQVHVKIIEVWNCTCDTNDLDNLS